MESLPVIRGVEELRKKTSLPPDGGGGACAHFNNDRDKRYRFFSEKKEQKHKLRKKIGRREPFVDIQVLGAHAPRGRRRALLDGKSKKQQ